MSEAKAIGTNTPRPKYSAATINAKSSSPQIPLSATGGVNGVIRVRMPQAEPLYRSKASRTDSSGIFPKLTTTTSTTAGSPSIEVNRICITYV